MGVRIFSLNPENGTVWGTTPEGVKVTGFADSEYVGMLADTSFEPGESGMELPAERFEWVDGWVNSR